MNEHLTTGAVYLAAALALALFLLPAAAEVRNPETADAFDTADMDGDGVVTLDEYRLFVVEEFYFSDTNRDGAVSDSDQHQWQRAPMEAADTDDSNAITLREMLNSSRHDFVDIDQDNNNVLTREEVEAYEAEMQ